ncbi:hypothetical protein VKT23_014794 [Stygiomarasmius scandens]|uniref:Amine oxidase n=1 Tax=Marasmiellus scandens TaxID=2682957 RepID=A0ABR1J1P1_9AGAR
MFLQIHIGLAQMQITTENVHQKVLSVGIVGGGMAGLYAALLLQKEGHRVHIFEASNRLGGRVYTHHFSTEPNQYFEAGAMRLPESGFQKIVFDLIKYLNENVDLPKERRIDLIPYVLNSEGNQLFINGVRTGGFQVMNTTPASIKWNVPPEYENKTPKELLYSVLNPFLERLEEDFDEGFKYLLQWDTYSFRFYLSSQVGWPDSVIDFVETVTSQTNQFALSVTELVMQNMDFSTANWYTIKDGMDRLPQAMAYVVGLQNITFGARITGIQIENTTSRVVLVKEGGQLSSAFDNVILAIPPAALKMISDRPRWDVEKEMAIRSMHFEPLYKIGMRFKTRFWETVCLGGQSTTDLPIRWIVYPSNGIGDKGSGVLLLYAWMTDAYTWLSLPPLDRRNLAIQCLQAFYPDVDVHNELIESFDVIWSTGSATGDAMFLPGQFTQRFEAARKAEGNIFFAGEHLSQHHTWIAGALLSSLYAVQQLVGNSALASLTSAYSLKSSSLKYLPPTPVVPGKVEFVDSQQMEKMPAEIDSLLLKNGVETALQVRMLVRGEYQGILSLEGQGA